MTKHLVELLYGRLNVSVGPVSGVSAEGRRQDMRERHVELYGRPDDNYFEIVLLEPPNSFFQAGQVKPGSAATEDDGIDVVMQQVVAVDEL